MTTRQIVKGVVEVWQTEGLARIVAAAPAAAACGSLVNAGATGPLCPFVIESERCVCLAEIPNT